MPVTAKPKLYNPRHPERTLLYQTVAQHYETWLELASTGQFDGQGDCPTPKLYVRQAFGKCLECGIFAHGFARARCDDCGHDYFVAFSCKSRGVCHSYIGAEAFIHRFGSSLNEHVHFHVCVVDGVFEDIASTPASVIFHPASGVDEASVAQVQTALRRRNLRAHRLQWIDCAKRVQLWSTAAPNSTASRLQPSEVPRLTNGTSHRWN